MLLILGLSLSRKDAIWERSSILAWVIHLERKKYHKYVAVSYANLAFCSSLLNYKSNFNELIMSNNK